MYTHTHTLRVSVTSSVPVRNNQVKMISNVEYSPTCTCCDRTTFGMTPADNMMGNWLLTTIRQHENQFWTGFSLHSMMKTYVTSRWNIIEEWCLMRRSTNSEGQKGFDNFDNYYNFWTLFHGSFIHHECWKDFRKGYTCASSLIASLLYLTPLSLKHERGDEEAYNWEISWAPRLPLHLITRRAPP